MNCTDIFPLLSGHLDHMNTAEEEALLLEHLNHCHDCRSLLKQMEQNDSLLAASCEAPPKDLTRRIMEQVRKSSNVSRRKKSRVISWLASGAVAAALLGVVITNGYLAPHNPELPAPQEVAEVPEQYSAASDLLDEICALPYSNAVEEEGMAETEAPGAYYSYSADDSQNLKKLPPLEQLTTESSLPFLAIWGAMPGDFEILEDYSPDKTDTLNETVKSALAEYESEISDEITCGKATVYTFITYTVPRDIMMELYEDCSDLYESYLFTPEGLYDGENCKIIFVQTDNSIPIMPQG